MLKFAHQNHINSYYAATRNILFELPILTEKQSVDVCIVGAGFFGLSTALELAQQGKSVVVLEGARVGFGASGRNGGQAIVGFADPIDEYIKPFGIEKARLLWNMSLEAMQILEQRIEQYQIQCDWKKGYATLALNSRRMDDLIELEKITREEFDYPHLKLWDKQELETHLGSKIYQGGLFDSQSGHLHPLNYCLGLAKACIEEGVQIYEHSPVIDIKTHQNSVEVFTTQCSVVAKDVVLATNAYIENLPKKAHRGVANKILPVESFVIATEPLDQKTADSLINNGMSVCDSNYFLDYYRLSEDNRLLFGSDSSTNVDMVAVMRENMLKVFPQLESVKIDYGWGGPVDMTMNSMPHFGRINAHIYFAQGFSGHGVALTGLAGRVVAESILGNDERIRLFENIKVPSFPGGKLLRKPTLFIGMNYYRFLDKFK